MELTGKNIKIHLLTPLVSDQKIMLLKAKLHEKSPDGFWVEPEGSKKLTFIPTHKIDFVEVA
jgi:hypothetical protein